MSMHSEGFIGAQGYISLQYSIRPAARQCDSCVGAGRRLNHKLKIKDPNGTNALIRSSTCKTIV
jgi:hypothetical protein